MRRLLDPYWLALALSTFVQLIVFLRWFYRRIRNDEITRAFVQDIATHHLPRIYDLLAKICDQQGIERAPLPPIRWINLGRRQ